jgi:ribonuclease E
MSKKMLINATHPEENRVATVEDGILTDLDIESEGREMTRGNIYKATVVRVEPGLQAAFIDYGAERLGFLQMGELHPSFFKAFEVQNEGKGRPRITDLLRRGQEVLVQVVKEERGTKGAALTTYLSLPGRYMVLMPESDTKGVSRKIEDDSQRKKLKEAMGSLDLPAGMGYIVRTAGIGQKPEELKRDFDYLVRVWENIQTISRQPKAPVLVYKESNLVIRSIRDYFSADMDEVLVDDPQVYEEARDFFQQVMPEYLRLVKLHQERRPIFSRYQIEEQIETLSRNKVPLPSGGSIVIDSTEALVAIDVNSGKMAGEQGVEGTAFRTNLEAAAEVGRQLRLRDLGGLIVVDFIDMRDRKHMRDIEKTLKDSLKNDKARVTVGKISQFGLLEMSRQRIKATLAEGSYLSCPNCGGSGRIKSAEAQAVAFLRKLHAAVARGQVERIEGEVPIDVAHYLLNTKREELSELERRYQVTIFIRARKSFIASQFELIVHKREKEDGQVEVWTPVTGGQHLAPLAVAAPLVPIPAAPIPAAPISAPPVPAAAAPAEPFESETEAVEDGGKKKRKRRRRKKKGESALAPGEAGLETAAAEPAAIGAPTALAAPAEVESLAAPAAAGTGEEPRKKRKRRRHKKRPETEGGLPGQSPADEGEGELPSAATPTPTPVEAPVAAAPASPVLEGDRSSAPAPSGPAARPPRKRRQPKAAAPAMASAPAPEAGVQSAAAASEPAPAAKVEVPSPSAPRPKAPPKATPAGSATDPDPGKVQPEKKPARRTRTGAKTGAALPAEQAPAAPAKATRKGTGKRPAPRKKTVEPGTSEDA